MQLRQLIFIFIQDFSWVSVGFFYTSEATLKLNAAPDLSLDVVAMLKPKLELGWQPPYPEDVTHDGGSFLGTLLTQFGWLKSTGERYDKLPKNFGRFIQICVRSII
ncbi:hypothetical protein FBY04_1523 [Pseudomonas sp. SJZ080]|uniref:hypothetical protein n=2 Tax=Pseudomonas TaxID=286 RepID=UPI00119A827E|nr:hypothetical protein [Pseudomonas sp. SJZ080]TWC44044.1 hypothetical protein FBY04_1523 [Pseudomonas sp. SJZ080]